MANKEELELKKNELLKCSICLNTFINPKVLPCMHTFCLKCIGSHHTETKGEKSKLVCPLCRGECDIPEGGLSNLPRNYFVHNFLEIEHITAANREKICWESYQSKGKTPVSVASVYCLDCQQHFCSQCHNAHDKMRFNKSHKIIEPGSLETDDLVKITLSFCEKHPDEPVKHYCLECKMIICLRCYIEAHSTHKCPGITTRCPVFIFFLEIFLENSLTYMCG